MELKKKNWKSHPDLQQWKGPLTPKLLQETVEYLVFVCRESWDTLKSTSCPMVHQRLYRYKLEQDLFMFHLHRHSGRKQQSGEQEGQPARIQAREQTGSWDLLGKWVAFLLSFLSSAFSLPFQTPLETSSHLILCCFALTFISDRKQSETQNTWSPR